MWVFPLWEWFFVYTMEWCKCLWCTFLRQILEVSTLRNWTFSCQWENTRIRRLDIGFSWGFLLENTGFSLKNTVLSSLSCPYTPKWSFEDKKCDFFMVLSKAPHTHDILSTAMAFFIHFRIKVNFSFTEWMEFEYLTLMVITNKLYSIQSSKSAV